MTRGVKRSAFIFDIDGTLALRDGREPYDWGLADTDLPNEAIITVARALDRSQHQILFVSGRPDDVRATTEFWLRKHVGIDAPLLMRARGDFRTDVEVKRELYHNEIRPSYRIIAVFDDRSRVVDLWRREMGLTCLQVAPGDF